MKFFQFLIQTKHLLHYFASIFQPLALFQFTSMAPSYAPLSCVTHFVPLPAPAPANGL